MCSLNAVVLHKIDSTQSLPIIHPHGALVHLVCRERLATYLCHTSLIAMSNATNQRCTLRIRLIVLLGILHLLNYLYSFARSSAIWADETPFFKFAPIYKIFYYLIYRLFCVWILCVIVSQPAIKTIGFRMFCPITIRLTLYYVISPHSLNVLFQVVGVK